VYPDKIDPFSLKLGQISSASGSKVSPLDLVSNLEKIRQKDAYEINFGQNDEKPIFYDSSQGSSAIEDDDFDGYQKVHSAGTCNNDCSFLFYDYWGKYKEGIIGDLDLKNVGSQAFSWVQHYYESLRSPNISSNMSINGFFDKTICFQYE